MNANCRPLRTLLCSCLLAGLALGRSTAAGEPPRPAKQRFAHPVVEDRYGVIAPWYTGQNGQCDFRVRIAMETLKRYPWAEPPQAVIAAPHFVFNGHWSIKPDGTVVVDTKLLDWNNGDVGQRSASLLSSAVDYYRYSGDPAAIGLIELTAEYVLDYCQTPAEHPWPGFFISCPTKGKAYGRADPHGFIQLDITAQVGSGLVAAYKLTGNPRFREAAQHWADLLARHCDRTPGAEPWNRYANPEDSKWPNTHMTGGIALIVQFLDDVIRLGHRGDDNLLVKARDAGDRHLRDALLPAWSQDPTWGRHFWDWENATSTCSVPTYVAQYLMNRPEAFPTWQTDVRNLMSLFFARASVDPGSAGDVYSGAWACPESSSCCGKSLQYPTQGMARLLARYGALSGDGWAQEVSRRQALLSTYDAHATGVVEDGIDGGAVVTGHWFNLAHPWPVRCVLEMLSWQPEFLGASRENHIMRSTSVVQNVVYEKGRIAYRTYDAAACEDLLRLAFVPQSVLADGRPLAEQPPPSGNGYSLKRLANGDCLLSIRHDGSREILVQGDDPQQAAEEDRLQCDGAWSVEDCAAASGGKFCVATDPAASATCEFHGNQVRLLGRVGPDGGKADVYLDGVKQLCGIDFWCPQVRDRQVVCYRNGLAQGKHLLKVVTLGGKNPRSGGTRVWIDAVQWSAAQGTSGFGEGRGPKEAQRVIFGYLGRKDYCDSQQRLWRPATEFVLRLHKRADLVPISFWTEPQTAEVAGTSEPELYRYGVFGHDFTAYFTVAPAESYSVRLKFCQAWAPRQPGGYVTSVDLQGQNVVADMDIAATAGGLAKGVDLVFQRVRPVHGVIAVRFWHPFSGEAMVQAIEVTPGDTTPGAQPVKFEFPPDMNLLANPGFEDGLPGFLGQKPRKADFPSQRGWSYRILSATPGIVWAESDFVRHPQSGVPKPRSGKEALRTHAQENGAHTQVYQGLRVRPQTAYCASAWVQAIDLRGKGFGTNPQDSAGLILVELDADGKVLLTHPKLAVTKAGDYVELSKRLVTSAHTATLRFVLDTLIGCKWDEGHVTYDDCACVQSATVSSRP